MNRGGKGEWICVCARHRHRTGKSMRVCEREGWIEKRQVWSIQKTEVERRTIGVN